MLTFEQSLQFTQLAHTAIQVHDESGFKELIANQVQPLLPHGIFLAVIGQLNFEHLTAQHHIAIGYPDWASAHLTQPLNIRERPILQRWLHTRAPVVACTVGDHPMMSQREQFEAQAMDMGRLAVHGLPDIDKRMGSYFSFARVTKDLSSQAVSHRLAMIAPLLHVALVQSFPPAQPNNDTSSRSLTSIEQELLTWLAAGRSNQEMAAMRQRSAATIRNQLNKLYAKLGVSSRTEAATLALRDRQHVPAPKVP